jgi:HK97 family phage major capsid protein
MSTELQKLADVIAQNNTEIKSVMAEYAASVNKAEGEVAQVKAEIKSIQESSTAEIARHREALDAEVKSRQALEAKLQRLPAGFNGEPVETPGAKFVNSAAYKSYQDSPTTKTSAAVEFKTLMNPTPIMNAPLQQTQHVGLIAPNYQTYHVRDLLAVSPIGQPSIEWLRETIPGGFTNNAAIVPESGLKPESFLTFEEKISSVKTIAHYAQITNQMLADNPMLANYIDTRLRYGLALKEDYELLYGDDSADSLAGIKNAGVQTYSWSAGDADDTMMDAILEAMVKSMISFYTPSGIVMNVKDMAKIRKSKSTTGEYLYETTSGQPSTLWGLPVVESTLMSEGEFIVGNFNMACNLFDRESVSMRIGEPGDSFLRNKKSILVEERLQLVVFRPSAIVWGQFDGAPTS